MIVLHCGKSVCFGVILVRIFPHLDQNKSECGYFRHSVGVIYLSLNIGKVVQTHCEFITI